MEFRPTKFAAWKGPPDEVGCTPVACRPLIEHWLISHLPYITPAISLRAKDQGEDVLPWSHQSLRACSCPSACLLLIPCPLPCHRQIQTFFVLHHDASSKKGCQAMPVSEVLCGYFQLLSQVAVHLTDGAC